MEEIESKAIFGRRLKRFREESGYTQSILANILGVERSTYTYYETGKTTPAIFDLMRLCRLYRISLDELCGYSANSVDAMRLSDSGQRVKVFEDGIKKTIQWYLDNREWWETIISGEYQNYYEKMYGNR